MVRSQGTRPRSGFAPSPLIDLLVLKELYLNRSTVNLRAEISAGAQVNLCTISIVVIPIEDPCSTVIGRAYAYFLDRVAILTKYVAEMSLGDVLREVRHFNGIEPISSLA